MAHFAEIDSNGVVQRVIVVGNKDTSDAQGNEKESIGKAFCERLFGGNWVQTSYNGNMRRRYAGIGYTYRADLDAFITPQPYPSWTLDPITADWIAPVAMPDDGKMYAWDEVAQTWVEVSSIGSVSAVSSTGFTATNSVTI